MYHACDSVSAAKSLVFPGSFIIKQPLEHTSTHTFVHLSIAVFWVVTPSGLVGGHHCSSKTLRYLLEDHILSQPRRPQSTVSLP
jgi:hypothetical protein